jgi:hypothetical protein
MKLFSFLTVLTLIISLVCEGQIAENSVLCQAKLPAQALVLREECQRIRPSALRLSVCLDFAKNYKESKTRDELVFIKCLEFKPNAQAELENESNFLEKIAACGQLPLSMDRKFECLNSNVPILQLSRCNGTESTEVAQQCYERSYEDRIELIPLCIKLKHTSAESFNTCVQTAKGSFNKLSFCIAIPKVQNQHQIQLRCMQSPLSDVQVAQCVYSDIQRGEYYLSRLEGIGCFPNIKEFENYK